MFKDERQRWILDKLDKDKKVSLVAVSQELDVSYDSIRRDIIELEERGLLKKVHGGAIANSYFSIEALNSPGCSDADFTPLAEKAQSLLRSRQTILMDGGTTNLHIARYIPHHLELTVITNSPPLAISLTSHPLVEVILLGGSVIKRHQITLGSETSSQLRHFKADLYFMGVAGIHPKEGLTVCHYEDSRLKRQMMHIASHTVICTTSKKINKVAAYQVCHLSDIHTLITSGPATQCEIGKWPTPPMQIL
ncbi:DeoR/GlpR family DNA-binding transcription regulator [Telluribacter humicola]|uniref:DeoR/GlpR family DNA-binding transcription regulator n=1 Tax=Telluribacter humicola TaxID=1720261 RepID=UPI001A97A593|nr:DeoR/GlpR family DNA-binding transcription regulator [Telluribacter humicola]